MAVLRALASLIATTLTIADGNPLLTADGSFHWIEAQVIPRIGSNSRVCGRPISPPRSSRLCASSAAAHSTTLRRELLS
eukprot:5846286-Pleurochrysis_carterae.AAC.1